MDNKCDKYINADLFVKHSDKHYNGTLVVKQFTGEDFNMKSCVTNKGLLVPSCTIIDGTLMPYYLLIDKDTIRELINLVKEYDDGR